MTVTKPATPEPEKPKRHRSPQHAAATAAIELDRLDEADAKAHEAAKERAQRRASILAALAPEAGVILKRMRGA